MAWGGEYAAGGSRLWSRGIRLLPWLLVAPLFLVPFGAAVMGGVSGSAGAPGGGIQRFLATLGSPSVQASLRFSLLQALASTGLSLLLGLPGAWLLSRYDFRGRRLYAALSGIPFVFPPVLFTLGFVRAWGRNGLVNSGLMALLGLEHPPLTFAYSFSGVVVAHALLNFPLVVALVGAVWSRVPRTPEDAARCLGAGEGRIFATITLPSILPGVAAAASLVFLYCFMSFAIPLTLGGGPQYATLEVSIYAAVSGEQDFARAGTLALLEGCCAVGVLALYSLLQARAAATSTDAPAERRPLSASRRTFRLASAAWLAGSGALGASPLLALLGSSFTRVGRWGGTPTFSTDAYARTFTDPASLRAMADSLLLALAVAALGVGIAVLLLVGEGRAAKAGFRSVFFALPVALSSVMLSLGYLVLFPLGAGVGALALVQATAAYPLAWRTLSAARSRIPAGLDEAAILLGADRPRILATVDLPLLRQALFSSLALCAAISLGEINAALMLNPTDFPLLGLRAYRLMGSYQYPLACALGVIVCLWAGLAFAAADRFSEEPR
ncbi:MAG TPA: iron ABC transporter permease [Holophaga sp.]|nr:iron ABC transporter permease [Holophaga sp.]